MPSELAAALAAVQAELPTIPTNQTGEVRKDGQLLYTYDYADLTAVSEAILPLLGKHHLAFTAWPTLDDSGRFVLSYSLLHESGEERTGMYPLPSGGRQQDIGGVITYARRYALSAVTGVAPGGEDNDAAGATEVTMDRRPGPDHTRLRRAAYQNPLHTADRPPAGAWDGEDRWVDQPPGELPPPLASPGQIRAIWTVLGTVFKFGGDEKDEARAVCARILGHPLASTKEMTKAEAGKVIDTLAEWQELAKETGMTPREFLTAEMVGASAAGEQDAAEAPQEPVDAP